MDFDFVLDENYLAFFILNRTMFNEPQKISIFKNKLLEENNIGYKKILEVELLDASIYLNNKKINELVDEFISTKKFNEISIINNKDTKRVLAIKILKNMLNNEDEEIEKIKDDLWYKFMDGYYTLLNMNSFNPSIFLLDNDVKKLIFNFKNTDIFKKIFKETENYYNNVKSEWEENKNKINNYLKNVLKIPFDINPQVYISHPNTFKGYTFDNDKIVWGHYNGLDDSYYNLVYLVHEGLHCLLPFYKNESEINANIKHTIIELIADNELYGLLSGKYTFNEGHSYLSEYKNFIYPYWLKYIGLEDTEIKYKLKNNSIKLNEICNVDLFAMNIYDFINFCVESYTEKMNLLKK